MRWGRTDAERQNRAIDRAFRAEEGRRRWRAWFAWRPVKLVDGSMMWLETVACQSVTKRYFFVTTPVWRYRPWADHVKTMMSGGYPDTTLGTAASVVRMTRGTVP